MPQTSHVMAVAPFLESVGKFQFLKSCVDLESRAPALWYRIRGTVQKGNANSLEDLHERDSTNHAGTRLNWRHACSSGRRPWAIVGRSTRVPAAARDRLDTPRYRRSYYYSTCL